MKIHKLNIRFILAKNKQRKDGKAPIFCRLTYLDQRKQFSTGLFTHPKQWNNKDQIIKPPTEENTFVNNQISLIKSKINEAFLMLQLQNKEFGVESIYNSYTGVQKEKDKLILEVFQMHNDKIEQLIGKDYAIPTLWKFKQSLNLLKDFILDNFNKKDYRFKDLDLKFIQDYEFFLKTKKSLAQATVNKAIQRFRKIVKIAMGEGFLNRDPFVLYKVKRVKKEIIYLNDVELNKLESYPFVQNRLAQVRDMFVFCCYTGLAYNEMTELEEKHLVIGFDGLKWIKMRRKKTNSEISIPLLAKAAEILNQYYNNNCPKSLPSISNQKFNFYLKEIAEIVGIDKKLTHHIARKTFATTVLLYNDVPMEIVSELLGHSKMAITQEHYGKIVQKKISEHMQNLSKRLEK